MQWNLFSFFLSNEEPLIELNLNLLETNIVNILILIAILVYAANTSFKETLEDRQLEIIQSIENAQKTAVMATRSYALTRKGFMQSILWLQSWKVFYKKERIQIVESKYKSVKNGFSETFSTSENLINNFEKKAFVSLQRYIVLITASKILRKFLFLTPKEQSKVIEKTILKLGEVNK
jgi:F0F1-type ATP synthase membrane subunit b/b'